MGEVFADTGYWIAIVNPRDGLHQRAQSIARQLGPNQIVTSEMVLAEFLNHMSQLGQHDRRLSIETVRRLRANSALEIVPQTSTQFWAATGRYGERLDQRWSLTDCASFLIMEARGIREALGSVVNCIFPSFHISVIPAEAGIQNPHQQCGIRSQIYPDPDYRRNDGRFDDTALAHDVNFVQAGFIALLRGV